MAPSGAQVGDRLLKICFWSYSELLSGDLFSEPGAEDKWCRRNKYWLLAANMGFGPDHPGSELLLPINDLTSLSLVSSSIRSIGLLY